MALLELHDVTVTYRDQQQDVPAVRGVSLALDGGQTLGLAGESGSGKSSLAHAVLRLLPPGTRLGGRLLLDGEDVFALPWGRLRAVRWAGASIVFQGAMHSLNPVRRIGPQIAEPILLHERATPAEARRRVADLLAKVALPPRAATARPSELSGGQQQRAMVAMALACSPRLVIADEATTALDAIARAQVLRLLAELAADTGAALLTISHDLPMLVSTCDSLAIMYAGRVVEQGPAAEIAAAPRHPYTAGLLAATAVVGDATTRLHPHCLPGDPPDPARLPAGCAFHPRCPAAHPPCTATTVDLRPDGPARHTACLHPRPPNPGQQPLSPPLPLPPTPLAQPLPPTLRGRPGRPAVLPSPANPAYPTRAPRSAPAGGMSGLSWTNRSDPSCTASTTVLSGRNVTMHLPVRRRGGTTTAVDGVDLDIAAGEIVALTGETGAGKTTLAHALVGLRRPTAGEIRYAGHRLSYHGRDLARFRRLVQYIPQDPSGSLNPRHTVARAVGEGLRIHRIPRAEAADRVADALARVGLRPAERFLPCYPGQLSEGQQQRVVLAAALALDPQVIVADEPVASLDASSRGEILDLLLRLRDSSGLSVLLVTHDLAAAWQVADRVAVLYLGRIVETGPADHVLTQPEHPYTRALLTAHTSPLCPAVLLPGSDPPDLTNIPPGCRFHPRCPTLTSGTAERAGVAAACRDHHPVPRRRTSGPGAVECHLPAAAQAVP